MALRTAGRVLPGVRVHITLQGEAGPARNASSRHWHRVTWLCGAPPPGAGGHPSYDNVRVSGRGRQAVSRAPAWPGFFTRMVPSVDESAEVAHAHKCPSPAPLLTIGLPPLGPGC